MADNKNVSYLLIGSGQLAKHLNHWLQLLNCQYETWDRSQDPHLLTTKTLKADILLLAISDSALLDFYRRHLEGFDKKTIHFSGALSFVNENLIGAHPLMTFGGPLGELTFYEKISFVLDREAPLTEYFPKMKNSWVYLKPELKPFYHSLCVLSGNFLFAMTQDLKAHFSDLTIPQEGFSHYMRQSLENALQGDWSHWSGPVARGDLQTQELNMKSLENHDLQKIYRFFQAHYTPRRRS